MAQPVKKPLRSCEVVQVTIVPCYGRESRDQNRVNYDFLDVRHRLIVPRHVGLGTFSEGRSICGATAQRGEDALC